MLWAKYKAKLIAGVAILAVLVVTHGAAYQIGSANRAAKESAKVVDVLKEEVEGVAKDGLEKAVKAETVATEVTRLRAELAAAKEESANAIKANEGRRASSCDLTERELRAIQALGNTYRP